MATHDDPWVLAPDSPFLQAHRLLSGVACDDEKGLPKTRYVTQGSKEDKDGRRAIADILRSQKPVPRPIRDELARLFDPTRFPHDRQIVFKRRAGNSPNPLRLSIIAAEIHQYMKKGTFY